MWSTGPNSSAFVRPAAVLVRGRRPDDVAGCVTALAEVHRLDGYPTRWPADAAGWLTPAGLRAAWVAVVEGTLAGHVALVDGRTEQRALLEVVDEGRSPAIALYERLGWRFVGQRTADWHTPSGVRPRLRRYVLPR